MKREISPIQIDVDLHKRLKLYCKNRGLVMKYLVEKLIADELSKDIQSNMPKS